MRIIEEQQLDFNDLLISPKRSTLNSRSEVNLFRDFEWIGGTGEKQHLNCIPIIAANMATIATPKIAKILARRGFMCALEKHLPYNELHRLYEDLITLGIADCKDATIYSQRIMPSIGVKESIDDIVKLSTDCDVQCVCVDVPNGYISKLIDRIKELHEALPNALIIAGNVVTPDISQDIILAGGMCAKVGIGPGCFLGNMKVLTSTGLKQIQDIEIGESVLSHNGKFEKIVNKFTFNTHKKIIDINGIKCTPNHKFYVAKIEDLNKITEENYKDFCIWVEAKDLDSTKYKLLKITPSQS